MSNLRNHSLAAFAHLETNKKPLPYYITDKQTPQIHLNTHKTVTFTHMQSFKTAEITYTNSNYRHQSEKNHLIYLK